MQNGGLRWYVAAVEPGHEYLAQKWLDPNKVEEKARRLIRPLGYETFLPEIAITRRLAYNRTRTTKGPYVPGYIFVRFDASHDAWGAINDSTGVHHILLRDGVPSPIREMFIYRLRAEVEAGDGVVKLSIEDPGAPKRNPLRKGSRVRIIGGPMFGREALYVEGEGARIKLMLDAMGGGVALETSETLVELVDPA